MFIIFILYHYISEKGILIIHLQFKNIVTINYNSKKDINLKKKT